MPIWREAEDDSGRLCFAHVNLTSISRLDPMGFAHYFAYQVISEKEEN